jgi:PRTRC genetic system protein E
MFKELFPLAAQGAFSLLLSADEASGLMTVVVVPKHSEGGKDVPALAMPLKLTAVPDELDAGFVQAVLSYSTHRASLDEQVAATNEVIEAAKAAAVKKGADAVTKAGPSPRSAAQHPRQRPATTTQTTIMVGTTPTMRPQRQPGSCRPRLPLRDRACLTSSAREGRQPCPSSLPLSPVASSTTG